MVQFDDFFTAISCVPIQSEHKLWLKNLVAVLICEIAATRIVCLGQCTRHFLMPKTPDNPKVHRISVGLDEATYSGLSAAAKAFDASLAWITRRAISEYLRRHMAKVQAQQPSSQSRRS